MATPTNGPFEPPVEIAPLPLGAGVRLAGLREGRKGRIGTRGTSAKSCVRRGVTSTSLVPPSELCAEIAVCLPRRRELRRDPATSNRSFTPSTNEVLALRSVSSRTFWYSLRGKGPTLIVLRRWMGRTSLVRPRSRSHRLPERGPAGRGTIEREVPYSGPAMVGSSDSSTRAEPTTNSTSSSELGSSRSRLPSPREMGASAHDTGYSMLDS